MNQQEREERKLLTEMRMRSYEATNPAMTVETRILDAMGVFEWVSTGTFFDIKDAPHGS